MRALTKTLSRSASTATLVVAACLLGACSGGENTYTPPPTAVVPPPVVPPSPPPPPPPPPTGDGSPQEQAGAGFQAAFNRDAFDEPVEPVQGDIIALDKTAEPIPILPDP